MTNPGFDIVPVTATITIDGVRYSHTEGVSSDNWTNGGDEYRDMVRTTVRDRLGLCLARELPVTVTDPQHDEDGTPSER